MKAIHAATETVIRDHGGDTEDGVSESTVYNTPGEDFFDNCWK